jgi:hypothetical protein
VLRTFGARSTLRSYKGGGGEAGVPRRHTGETLRYGRVRGHNGRGSRGAAAPNSSVTTYHVRVAFQACISATPIRPLRVMHKRLGDGGWTRCTPFARARAFICAQDSKREMVNASRFASVTVRLLRSRFTGNDLMALIS